MKEGKTLDKATVEKIFADSTNPAAKSWKAPTSFQKSVHAAPVARYVVTYTGGT